MYPFGRSGKVLGRRVTCSFCLRIDDHTSDGCPVYSTGERRRQLTSMRHHNSRCNDRGQCSYCSGRFGRAVRLADHDVSLCLILDDMKSHDHTSDGCPVYSTGERRRQLIERGRACRTCLRYHNSRCNDRGQCSYCSGRFGRAVRLADHDVSLCLILDDMKSHDHTSDGCPVYSTGERRRQLIERGRACRTCLRYHNSRCNDRGQCRYCSGRFGREVRLAGLLSKIHEATEAQHAVSPDRRQDSEPANIFDLKSLNCGRFGRDSSGPSEDRRIA
ncbi:unnamed protein product [Caenorhabditis auriculariae]|uniref:Uncharacterized protein n=1 Tax=Caenorhabditis auriculariae TaxID=2777116 RepID=A0A8S1H3M5_9PELO|nr:unnamed protein product [Caenorhabditis auriculariae]